MSDENKPLGWRFTQFGMVPTWDASEVDPEATADAPLGYGWKVTKDGFGKGKDCHQAFLTWEPSEFNAEATRQMYEAHRRKRIFVYKTAAGTTYSASSTKKDKTPFLDRKEGRAQRLRVYKHHAEKCANGEMPLSKWLGHMQSSLKSAAIYRATRPDDQRDEAAIMSEAAQDVDLQRKLKILDGLFVGLQSGKLTFDSREFASRLGELAKAD